jgi:putative phosphoesterase
MRVGIISDTHGLLHPRVKDLFAGVDHIIHAGDVGDDAILRALRRIAPLTYVRGNNDDSTGCDVKRVVIGGVRFLVTHILPRPSKPGSHVTDALRREGVDVVVFGHSHLPHNEVVGGIRYFNPASAGPRRFDYPSSVGIIDDGGSAHIALDERSFAALEKHMNRMR